MIHKKEVWIQNQTHVMPLPKPLDYKLRKRKRKGELSPRIWEVKVNDRLTYNTMY